MKPQVWVSILMMLLWSRNGVAQVVPDQTLSVGERSQVSGGTDIQIEGGATRGNNLFHSFRQFSIPTGGSASFNNASDITNIITRVTGNNVSDIDGIIRANGTANLFLINPNGILLGANARLEIGGSFLASTAAGLKFANGFEFSARDPQAPPLLTVSAPIGLQYGDRSGGVRSQGAVLQVPDGQTLNLIGGNVAINGGQLLAPGGRVELAGVAAAGEVGLRQQGQDWRLRVPGGLRRADVAIGNDAEVNVRSDSGGSIAITARNFTGTGLGTRLRAGIAAGLGTVEAQAGDININATEAINLDEMMIANDVVEDSTGNAGNINITTGTLSLTNGAVVGASTFGQGNAGNVTITASDAVSFDGMDRDGFSSGAFSSVEAGGIGQGGNVSITTGTLSLTNGAVVGADTFGQGNAGNVTITANDSVSFDGEGSDRFPSGAFSGVEDGGVGQGGNVSITTGTLSLTNGGAVGASTFGQGNAGNVMIMARDAVSFDGEGSAGVSSGAFSRVGSEGIGQGGTIAIHTDRFSITSEAQLTASSEGQGAAGDLEVVARQLRLDNQGSIQAETTSGQGGNITLQISNLLLLRHGSFISTTAGTDQSGGNGGDITFNDGFIVAVPEENSNISANAFSGRGGNIRITTQGVFGIAPRPSTTPGLSSITASSQTGISGTITLNTLDVDPSRGTSTLPRGVSDTNALIASSCVAQRRQQGRFVITGTGGLTPQPDDLANAAFPTYELVQQSPSSPSAAPPSAAIPEAVIPEADQMYRTATGEIVLGRSCQ
ncbi:MAG: filamentous hemagglutinin N-terminal domain-containing protein [Oculatellaceae cyanobacterium Prado106]|nr:filamentous hemagglutinin N-terminal domain-containing protein [Oculatellaceae cyanobacterium Prado106]